MGGSFDEICVISYLVEMKQGKDAKPRVQIISGTIGAVIAGALPVILSLTGIWGYVERGYLLNRNGHQVRAGWPTLAGLAWYAFLIVAGGLSIRWGVSYYRRHSRSKELKPSEPEYDR